MSEEHHHHHHRRHSSTSDASLSRDARYQQYRRVASIMPGIILVIGFLVWSWAIKQDKMTNSWTGLAHCGILLMIIGGGVLLVFLIAEWSQRIREAREDRKRRRQEHHHHHHRHHRHHHHAETGVDGGEK